MSLKFAYIMRGLPGSGKSTLAADLAGDVGIVHSTDTYFVDEDGVYRFDPRLLPVNHEKNFQAFCASIDRGVPVVICDNTNIIKAHFRRYHAYALRHGYAVRVVAMPMPSIEQSLERNTHDLPRETIVRLHAMWEE